MLKNWNAYLERVCSAGVSRKGFLKLLGAGFVFALFSGKYGKQALAKAGQKQQPRKKRAVTAEYDLVVAKGKSPELITRKAVEALGGMGRFVRKGDVVVVKPNIGWDRTPEQAANTNPEVVAALVKMCFESGAKAVKVFDNPCNDARRCYENSGIQQAARKAGATVFYVSDWKYVPADMPQGYLMNEWPVMKDAAECDCFINVPIAKHHGIAKLTLSMKNLMGVCGASRGGIHRNMDQRLTELTEFFKPDLTVIDAYRVLLRHGPTGGDLADVAEKNTIVAGTDPVLADAYATRFFNMQPAEIGYIRYGAQKGIGSMNVAGAKIKELAV